MAEYALGRVRYGIPEDLIDAVKERRVIPFLGAGFSATVGLPDWGQLLQRLCAEIDTGGLTFKEISDFAHDDYLQIAEYLFIKSDRRIGPLRHVIEQGFNQNSISPILSGAHVELVNLGAPQIYTTNYDDLIESTYRDLGLPFSVVALPKDVASVNDSRTQIIKYHGDLRHESTLVLTESAYYKRLDFESPMDLKFRSDLLGRSVLYMGYSFRDINIRLIWFKLMQMTQDIPAADRRHSYIVRLTPNPVLDELYQDVGLRAIVLDPQSRIAVKDHPLLLGDFLGELASLAGHSDGIPGTHNPLFVSSQLLAAVEAAMGAGSTRGSSGKPIHPFGGPTQYGPISRLLRRTLPAALQEKAKSIFLEGLPFLSRITQSDLPGFAAKLTKFGPDSRITSYFVRILRGGQMGSHILRREWVAFGELPWDIIWGAPLSEVDLKWLIEAAKVELRWTDDGNADDDIAYLADILKRVVAGSLRPAPEVDFADELVGDVNDLLGHICNVYPSVASYTPELQGAPSLEVVLAEISQRKAQVSPSRVRPYGTEVDFDDVVLLWDGEAESVVADDDRVKVVDD